MQNKSLPIIDLAYRLVLEINHTVGAGVESPPTPCGRGLGGGGDWDERMNPRNPHNIYAKELRNNSTDTDRLESKKAWVKPELQTSFLHDYLRAVNM